MGSVRKRTRPVPFVPTLIVLLSFSATTRDSGCKKSHLDFSALSNVVDAALGYLVPLPNLAFK